MGRGQPPNDRKDFWAQVAEIERTTGVPRQLAQQVVAGQLSLNDALEKLALQDRVEGLMRRHDMSRALATQIALGHADLSAMLRKVRMRAHKEANYGRSILDEAHADGRTLMFALHDHRSVEGVIADIDRYEFTLKDAAGASEQVHKLAVKYIFAPGDAKRVRRAMRFNKAIKDNPKGPILRPQDRYTCSDRRLFGYIDSEVMVRATTLEGEVFRGQVQIMCRYELVLKLKGGVELIIFRHALADLSEA